MKKILILSSVLFLAGCSISFGPADTSVPPAIVSPSPETREITVKGIIQKIPSQGLFGKDQYTIKTDTGTLYTLESPLSEDFSADLGEVVTILGQLSLKTEMKNGEIPVLTVLRVDRERVEDDLSVRSEISNGVSAHISSPWILEKGETTTTWNINSKTTNKNILQLVFHTPEEAVKLLSGDFLNGQALSIDSISAQRILKGSTHRILLEKSPFLEITFLGADTDLASFYNFLLSIKITPDTKTTPEPTPTVSPSSTKTPSASPLLEPTPKTTLLPSPTPSATKSPSPTVVSEVLDPNASPSTPGGENQDQLKVIKAINDQLSSLAPEKAPEGETWKITRTIFSGTGVVSVEYASATEKRKTVFKYSLQTEISFEVVAHYKPGITTTWILIQGNAIPSSTTNNQDVYLPNGTKAFTLPAGYELYVSKNFTFQVAYPKKLYYSSIGQRQGSDVISTLIFAKEPATLENAIMLLEIVSGKTESGTLENSIVVARDEKTHFRLTAKDLAYLDTIKAMAATLQIL